MKTLLAIVLALLASCATMPIVAYSVFEGQGAVYSDTNALVAFGSMTGETGAFMKGSAMPVTIPLIVNKGECYLYNGTLGIDTTQLLTEPLPLWAKELIPVGHLAPLKAATGIEVRFSN
jgi:hypothetical protein